MQPHDSTFWLMPGETPIGPYRADEILAQIQTGSCSWTTKASQVGSQTWLPLNQLLTLAPVAILATGSETSASTTVAPSTPPLQQETGKLFSTPRSKYIVITLGAIVAIYYFWNTGFGGTSMSPQQVCHAFFSAKNVAQARKYVTPNLHAAMDMVATQPDFGSDDDNGKLELTSEQPAPSQAGGGYYVGYRAHSRDANGLQTMEGVFQVMDQSGWKVHDWFIFAINGQNVQPPISLAKEYEFFRDPQSPAVAGRQMTEAKKQAQQWYSNKQLNFVAATALFKSGLGKWIVGIIAVVGVAIVGFFKNQQGSSKPSK